MKIKIILIASLSLFVAIQAHAGVDWNAYWDAMLTGPDEWVPGTSTDPNDPVYDDGNVQNDGAVDDTEGAYNDADDETAGSVLDAVNNTRGEDANPFDVDDENITVRQTNTSGAEEQTSHIRGRAAEINDDFNGALAGDGGFDPNSIPAVEVGDYVVEIGNQGEAGYERYIVSQNTDTGNFDVVYREVETEEMLNVEIMESSDDATRDSRMFTRYYGEEGEEDDILEVQPENEDTYIEDDDKWTTTSAKNIRFFNNEGENVTGENFSGMALFQEQDVDPAEVSSVDMEIDPETGQATSIILRDSEGNEIAKVGGSATPQDNPETNPSAAEGADIPDGETENPGGGGGGTLPANDLWNAVNNGHEYLQSISPENRYNEVLSRNLTGLGIEDADSILALAKSDPQAAVNSLLNTLGFDDEGISGYLAASDKIGYLKDYYISLGYSEEEALVKAKAAFQTLQMLSIYPDFQNMSDSEKLIYLTEEAGLSEFTAHLIIGDIEDSDLIPVKEAIDAFFAKTKLDSSAIAALKEKLIDALYTGSIQPENIEAALNALAEEMGIEFIDAAEVEV